MVRKVVGIGVVVLLVGALIGGGAYLLLRDGNGDSGNHGRQGQAGALGAGGQGGRWNSGTGEAAGGPRRGGGNGGAEALAGEGRGGRRAGGVDDTVLVERGGGHGRGGEDGAGTTQANVAPEEWLTVSGVVVEMEEDLVVRTADGAEVTFGLGPSWYRESRGVTIAVGDEVRVTGFYEDGDLLAGTVENLSAGQSLALRDTSGRPLWSGRGRRGQ